MGKNTVRQILKKKKMFSMVVLSESKYRNFCQFVHIFNLNAKDSFFHNNITPIRSIELIFQFFTPFTFTWGVKNINGIKFVLISFSPQDQQKLVKINDKLTDMCTIQTHQHHNITSSTYKQLMQCWAIIIYIVKPIHLMHPSLLCWFKCNTSSKYFFIYHINLHV